MRRLILLLLSLLLAVPVAAQESNTPFESAADVRAALEAAVEAGTVDEVWAEIEAAGTPLIFGETVVFLYRGNAETVEWRGDFTGWDSDPAFIGEQIGDSDIWLLEQQFPPAARLDYKIVTNGSNWLLDPLNPQQQVGGFGPNSMFAMPEYVPSPALVERDDIAKGTLSENIILDSTALGYEVRYKVYTPAGYEDLTDLPVIYVTDGHEYANPEMGTMITVLDNLIADGIIQPVIAVFIDPRAPGSGVNRREVQYITNVRFVSFLADELVPAIDAAYPTQPAREARAILGTSLGGLNAAFVGLTRSEVFALIGINSPAFWVKESILDDYENSDPLPLKVFMSLGSINDDIENTRRMRDILEEQGYDLHYLETPEGHSWGNWRNLLDDLLIYFFGVE